MEKFINAHGNSVGLLGLRAFETSVQYLRDSLASSDDTCTLYRNAKLQNFRNLHRFRSYIYEVEESEPTLRIRCDSNSCPFLRIVKTVKHRLAINITSWREKWVSYYNRELQHCVINKHIDKGSKMYLQFCRKSNGSLYLRTIKIFMQQLLARITFHYQNCVLYCNQKIQNFLIKRYMDEDLKKYIDKESEISLDFYGNLDGSCYARNIRTLISHIITGIIVCRKESVPKRDLEPPRISSSVRWCSKWPTSDSSYNIHIIKALMRQVLAEIISSLEPHLPSLDEVMKTFCRQHRASQTGLFWPNGTRTYMPQVCSGITSTLEPHPRLPREASEPLTQQQDASQIASRMRVWYPPQHRIQRGDYSQLPCIGRRKAGCKSTRRSVGSTT